MSLLCSRALTEQLTDILYADLYECDFAGNLECDAADRDGEPVLLSFFCDLPRIKRFDTALQLQNKCGTLTALTPNGRRWSAIAATPG